MSMWNCIFPKYIQSRGVVITVRAPNKVDPGVDPLSGFEIGICCCLFYSSKQYKWQNNYWLARRLLCPSQTVCPIDCFWVSYQYTNHQPVGLAKTDIIFISLKTNLFTPWNSWQIAHLAINSIHSLHSIKTRSIYQLMCQNEFWHYCMKSGTLIFVI